VRRGLLVVAAMALCCGVFAKAQQNPHPLPPPRIRSPLGALLGPMPHARPPAKDAIATPEVLVDATGLGSPQILDKNWRVGITGNQAAATPDFDDTTWDIRNASDAIAEVPDEDRPPGPPPPDGSPVRPPDHPPRGHQRPFVWFRLHILLAPNHGPISLLIQLPVSQSATVSTGNQGPGVDVYANGKEIHPEGPGGDDPSHYQPISRIYNLNIPSSQTELTLALRTLYIPFGFGAYTSFFSNRTLHLGHPEDLNRTLELWSVHSLFERLPRIISGILLLVLASFLFALYFAQKGHREYLWLALHELVQAPIAFVDLAGSTANLDQLWYAASVIELVLISAYLYFEFLVSFLALRPRWYIRWLRYTAPILAFAGPFLLMVGRYHFIGWILLVVFLGCFFWFVGWLLFCGITLVAATIKRNFEAGLLLLPLILSFVGILEPLATAGMKDFSGHPYRSPLTLQAGPVPIHFATVADFIGMLAIVTIIFARFLRIHRDRERASSELAAARSVQELMIPQERLKTPGFEVDSVYNPANEVGGDFFHVESTPDGGLLVVIGDVAGKGLKAAMNVSMLMGALRRTPDRGPAKILQSLNRVLVDSDSFTTCQAAWFGPNGELVVANAGHLPPYLNSQEVYLPGGLPLGVLTDITYEEVRMYLHPGDRLLLMSDGVVEARHSSGELFGFERVHNLSSQSAFYIADAAKEFGQEDDITVLTVRRLAQAVAA
jgi:sigma-B regulation protein RsbU (phosphoserine phosphatase)